MQFNERQHNTLFASKAKINVFWHFFEWIIGLKWALHCSGVLKKFQNTLVLASEVIVQPRSLNLLNSLVQPNLKLNFFFNYRAFVIIKRLNSAFFPIFFSWLCGLFQDCSIWIALKTISILIYLHFPKLQLFFGF